MLWLRCEKIKQMELSKQQIDKMIRDSGLDKIIKACENGDKEAWNSILEDVLEPEDDTKKLLNAEQKKENKSIWDKISD